MNVLIIGSGGREHALYLKISESPLTGNVYGAPGNAGFPDSKRIAINPLDFEAVGQIVTEKEIHLLVVGPEQPLVKGIRDYLSARHPGLKIFGPNAEGAQLEGSKSFSAEFMEEAGIPAGKSSIAHNLAEALSFLENHSLPVVIKADGLAAGKGVSIHSDKKEAEDKLKEIFEDKKFGEAGNIVLLQEFLSGREASLFAICNGSEAILLPPAQDYKRARDNDQGDNTGGMGSYCPGHHLTPGQMAYARSKIIEPVLQRFAYHGLLYVGLMVHGPNPEDISVVEFNSRFGDPETQVVLSMIEGDLLPYLLWSAGEDIVVPRMVAQGYEHVPVKPGAAVNVVLAGRGYPGEYATGFELQLELPEKTSAWIVHAGTQKEGDRVVASGGRVASVVSRGSTVAEARSQVYAAIDALKQSNNFDSLEYRSDIAANVSTL